LLVELADEGLEVLSLTVHLNKLAFGRREDTPEPLVPELVVNRSVLLGRADALEVGGALRREVLRVDAVRA
jgi:hypothetical protein